MNRDIVQSEVNTARGLLSANIAVLLFGLAGVLGKLSMLPAPLIVLGRVVFAGGALVIVVLARRVDLRPRRRRDLALLIGQGALLAVHWTAFFASISVSNVAIGLLSFSSFPLFTAFLEPLLLRQRANRFQIAAAFVILFGIYLLVPSFSLTLFLLPTTTLFTPRELGILLLLGVGCTAIAHTLFIAGMRDITAQLASLFGSLEPVWGILFALLLLDEVPSLRTLIGGAIILLATLAPVLAPIIPKRCI